MLLDDYQKEVLNNYEIDESPEQLITFIKFVCTVAEENINDKERLINLTSDILESTAVLSHLLGVNLDTVAQNSLK